MMASALFLGCSTDDSDSGDGVACAVKITESDGTYTLEWWGCYGDPRQTESGKYIITTENFTAKDLVKISPYDSGYEKYGYRYYFKGKSDSRWELELTDNGSVFYDCLTNFYTRRDSNFDFYTGTEKESSSSSDDSGSSSGSLPSDFDITAGTWTYTGTAGNTSITYTVTFKSDGTVTKSGKSQASGTWSLSGSTLTLDVKNSSTEAADKFTLSSSGSSLTLTLSGDSSYTTAGSSYKTSAYSMALTVMFMSSSKTATLTSSN